MSKSNSPAPTIFDCPFYPVTEADIETQMLALIASDVPGYAVAINAEKIYRFQTNPVLQQTINQSVFPYPDGSGAVMSLRFMHGLASEKINMPIRMLELANKHCLPTFIVGANEAIHISAIDIIKQRYPSIKLVGNMHGYHSEVEIESAIISAQPQVVMLALGSPKQEYFAAKLSKKMSNGIIIGCGGALDILAGRLKRAPEFIINNNLEWLYRLIQEPWRWRRQLFLFPFFTKLFYQVIIQRVLRRSNEKN